MRIDDEIDNEPLLNYNELDIENTMNEIDKLIGDISISESSLRKRKVSSIYVSSKDLHDIDDVIININTPVEYYTNKERRIMKYTDYNILVYIINLISYLVSISLKTIIYVITNKKEKLKF